MGVNIRGMVPLIQVFDMPASLRFYCEQLGFELVQSAGPEGDMGWAMLRWPIIDARGLDAKGSDAKAPDAQDKQTHAAGHDLQLMLNTQYELPDRPAAQEPARRAAHGDTALYFGCPDVDAAYAHLRAKGVQVAPPYVTGYGFKAVDVTDPDGYHLSFHWPVEGGK